MKPSTLSVVVQRCKWIDARQGQHSHHVGVLGGHVHGKIIERVWEAEEAEEAEEEAEEEGAEVERRVTRESIVHTNLCR